MVRVVNILYLQPKTNTDFYFVTTGTPYYTPSVIAFLFYLGNKTEARAAFVSLFVIGASVSEIEILTYDQ